MSRRAYLVTVCALFLALGISASGNIAAVAAPAAARVVDAQTVTRTPAKTAVLTAVNSPGQSIDAVPAYTMQCQNAPTSSQCQDNAIAALNNARAKMNQPAYNLPPGFESLSQPMQLLVLANSDRALYGLSAIAGLNATLNAIATAAANSPTPADPVGPNSVDGAPMRAWTSNWAGGWTSALYVYYNWMYDDGPGSSNLDCPTASSPGCWGHRTNTLYNFGSAFVAMGVGMGTYNGGQTTFTELFEGVAAPVGVAAAIVTPIASQLVNVAGSGGPALVSVYWPRGVYVRQSSANGFAAAAQWSSADFYGTRSTQLVDINGDGRADLVAVNDGSIWVMLSTGSGFGAPQPWSTIPFYGTVTTTFADVNGDGKIDAVAVSGSAIWVMTGTGSGFAAPQPWSSTPFYGARATTFVDVNKDGKADAVAVNGNSVWVMLASASGFGVAQPWSGALFYGDRSTVTADVNGDGRADVVAINSGSVWVMLAGASGFGAPTMWSDQLFYGSQATLAGDVNGDKMADLVAVNDSSIFVELSSGSGMGTVQPF